jgi:phosphatidylserine/phosphatidylglycerophosphate/cardiolipin synthase-like enzyme
MRHALAAVLVSLVCAAVIAVRAAPAAAPTAADGRPTASDPVHLLLRDPTGTTAPNTLCDMPFCEALLELIQKAEHTVDFAVYGVRGQPAILDALAAAQARGVRVRGVVDRDLAGKNYYSDTESMVARLGTIRDDLLTDKRTADTREPYDPAKSTCWMDAPVGFDGPKQCVGYDLGDSCLLAVHVSSEAIDYKGDIMHDKFFVVDGTYVWMGSTNVSDSCSGGYNSNLVAVVNSPVVAGWYAREFEQMYAGQYHREKGSSGDLATMLTSDISLQAWFSPQDDPMDRAVRPVLQAAKERIDVAIFYLTHKGIAADLIAAHRRGVKVRVIVDATSAGNGYTKHELLRVAGITVKVENWGGKMHTKAAAVDGKVVVMGSMNWTSAGENGNDENTMVLRSAKHAQQFHTFFDQAWSHIPDRWLEGRPDAESPDSIASCTDGVDNDYDHLTDDKDPGCGPNPPPLAALPPWQIVPKGEGWPVLKANISESGTRTYHVPGGEWYDEVQVTPADGEGYFCSEEDARKAGFRRSSR